MDQLSVQSFLLCSLTCLDSRVNLLNRFNAFACCCYHHSGSFPTVGVANPLEIVGVVVGLLPLFCFCCFVWFAFFSTKRKSGRGICGSSAVVSGCCVVCLIGFAAEYMTTVLCTEFYFIAASLSVRTEPLSDIGQIGGKKRKNDFEIVVHVKF